MQKAAIMAIIFCDFFMFGKISLSPQVKQRVIINNKHGIYQLPHELLNDIGLAHGIFADDRGWVPTQGKRKT